VTALRSLWNGTLALEQLRVPVALAATRAGAGDVSLRTLHRNCSHPLVELRQCPIHGDVPAEEIVAGWEVAPGEFVLLEQDELDGLVTPLVEQKIIDVLTVVAADAVDPILTQSAYWLMPAAGEYAHKGYALISSALGAKELALVARFNYRSEKVAAITHVGGAMLLQVLGSAAERIPAAPIQDELAGVEISDQEFRLIGQLLKRRTGKLDESLLVNRRRDALRSLIESKVASNAPRAKAETELQTFKLDRAVSAPASLVDALKASLRDDTPRPAPARRRRTAKAGGGAR
jgi:DNA end-binding protein Ku